MADNLIAPPPPAPLLVRPPAHYDNLTKAPGMSPNPRAFIAFYHPAYSTFDPSDAPGPQLSRGDCGARIFQLPAFDNGGLHYGTALAACAVIACNKTGYFTSNSPHGTRVQLLWDDVLPAGERYYYHLDDPNEPPEFPICTSFRDWVFAPEIIPQQWSTAFDIHTTENPIVTPSNMSIGIHTRDVSCRITDSRDEAENAHIVPRAEDTWFRRNAMYEYNNTLNPAAGNVIDDVRNGFLIRRDLHHAFDSQVFCLAVKEGKVVVHFINRTHEMGMYYHNAEFRLPSADPCVEFVWARFAWTIIPLARLFIGGNMLKDTDISITLQDSNKGSVGDAAASEDTHRAKRKNTGRGRKEAKRSRTQPPGGKALGASADQNTKEVPYFRSVQQESYSSLEPVTPPSISHQEAEQDRRKQERYFPLMNEETTWSNAYTWQTAPWYPGMGRMQRIKEWYKENHPQISAVADDGVEEDGTSIDG